MIKDSLTNHVVFVVDASSSIEQRNLTNDVAKVVDNEIAHLADRSKALNQETRVSIYVFADKVDCLVYDTDVLRLPPFKKHYAPYGNTALIGGTLKAIEDLKKTPELYGSHGFLMYVITDGENNIRNDLASELTRTIKGLPDNWTVAIFVPNSKGKYECKNFGFPADNISIWTTDSAGVAETGQTMRNATENYMVARSTGLRSTKNLFALDASSLNASAVKNNLEELKTSQYDLLPVRQDRSPIKDFCETWLGEYRIGSAYYELSKKETIQAGKQLAVQNKVTGRVFAGLQARKLLNLPNHEIKVAPENHGNFRIFVQSTSTNRLLVKDTQLLVLK